MQTEQIMFLRTKEKTVMFSRINKNQRKIQSEKNYHDKIWEKLQDEQDKQDELDNQDIQDEYDEQD